MIKTIAEVYAAAAQIDCGESYSALEIAGIFGKNSNQIRNMFGKDFAVKRELHTDRRGKERMMLVVSGDDLLGYLELRRQKIMERVT